jgi:phosphoribosyl-ATP pyrophosphohydrolase
MKVVMIDDTIAKLETTIADRRRTAPADSYTASLFAAGLPRIAQKVGEEGVETVVAALSQEDGRLVAEMADLVYHCLVLLAARDLCWQDVEQELARRFK